MYSEERIGLLLKDNGFKLEAIERNLITKNSFTSNEVLFIKATKM